MGKKKHYYAVRKGRKVGIFSSWNECQGYVLGFKDARFKGFQTREEAEDYMKNGSGRSKKNRKEPETVPPVVPVNRIQQQRLDLLPVEPALPSQEALRTLHVNGKDCAPEDLFAYIGVSIDKDKKIAGYGVVMAQQGEVVLRDLGAVPFSDTHTNQKTVAEAAGIQKALELAIANNFTAVFVVAKHLKIEREETGEWLPCASAGRAFRTRIQNYGQVIDAIYIHADRSPICDLADYLSEKAVLIA